MSVPVSSLSIAVQGIADFLDGQFGEEVVISTDNPLRASERSKNVDKHFLNLFVYRIMPSGFHTATTVQEPNYIRINALLTPFPGDMQNSALDADLRILGHAIRVLHAHPVIPTVLPGGSLDPTDFRSQQHVDYRLQSILLSPTMEELNHIWTTQGGDLAYRLSAAYEFALIPIEPLEHSIPPVPVTTSVIDIQPHLGARDMEGFIEYGDEAIAIPMGGIGPEQPLSPITWLPVVLIVDEGVLKNSVEVPEGTAALSVTIAGPPGERVALEVSWVRNDETEDVQAPVVVTVATPRIDDPAGITLLPLTNAGEGDSAVVLVRPVDDTNQPIATSPYANTLSITVGAAG